jgi:HAD superfamily hydrolase (TIGR01509 family)
MALLNASWSWQALAALGRTPDEAVMLDDLSPGISMANAAGIEAVGAGWGHQVCCDL